MQEKNVMRAALYARVSSEEQVEGYSIDAQRRAFNSLVETRGWQIYKEYLEEGKSARTEDINKRPVFKAIIDDAMSGKFDVLVVHKLDRFSRNLRITLEYFDKLLKAGVTFVSINEQMDFTSPSGKVHLALLGAFAQYYSDNLSQETKKGWAERKAQGLYCGHLPFGAMKGKDGIPVPDPNTYPGLKLAFDLAAQGKCDREVAVILNANGYRTAGIHGNTLLSKDTVSGILTNTFYIGYLSANVGGLIKAKHEPFIQHELFELVQNMRQKNLRSTHKHTVQGNNIYSLTGITWCWHCKEMGHKGRMHVSCVKDGKVRLGCYNRTKGWKCPQKSTFLSVYEEQIRAYIDAFQIPADYQQRIIEMHQKMLDSYGIEKDKKRLNSRLDRLKELYSWGDITKDYYQKSKEQILEELAKLSPVESSPRTIQKLAEFLSNIGKAWDAANHEQKNKLARSLFEEIWVKDKLVVAVKPQPELEPFFKLNWDEFVKIMKLKVRIPSAPPRS